LSFSSVLLRFALIAQWNFPEFSFSFCDDLPLSLNGTSLSFSSVLIPFAVIAQWNFLEFSFSFYDDLP
jgi:hypothetical protein